MIVTISCLTLLLLMSTKVINSTGDMPYAIKFVPVSYIVASRFYNNSQHFFLQNGTPSAESIERKNNQPCIVAAVGDVFNQY